MTETKTSPLADIAPYPLVEADATAQRMIRYYCAFGLMHDGIAMETTNAERDQFLKSIGHVISSFAVAHLLRALRKQNPAEADEAARALWVHLDGGELAEWLWEWGSREGLDCAPIADVSKQVLAAIRAKQAADAETAAHASALSAADLDAIRARHAVQVKGYAPDEPLPAAEQVRALSEDRDRLIEQDVPALLAEIERLRERAAQ